MKTFHAVLLSGGLVVSSAIFGMLHYESRAGRDELRVTGAAKEGFLADTVKWRITLTRLVPQDEAPAGYRQLRSDGEILLATLEEIGISRESVTVKPANTYLQYDHQGQPSGLNFNQEYFVISQDVDGVEGFAINPAALFERGIVLQGSYLEYFYSGIDELKHTLLSAATLDARRRAEEIVGGTDQRLGALTSARVGVFQITEPFSTEVSDYGMYSTSTREKEITVTVHATYGLK